MWPFNSREPLDPQKLPLPDTWTALKGNHPEGKTMVVRANTGYGKFKGVAGYGHEVSIAVPLVDSDRQGFPTPAETQELKRIEKDLREVLEPKRESLLVAVTTIPGIREFIFYTRNPDAVQRAYDNDILARVFSHRVHLKIQPDKDWTIYRKLL